eukprot:scaffold9759_cov64-Cyclotella_meneghiniana.AAC.1
MSYQAFCSLHEKLESGIIESIKEAAEKRKKKKRSLRRRRRKGNNPKPPPPPNGDITTSVRLACALRYFSGGSPYDIMSNFGVSHSEMMDSRGGVHEQCKQCLVEGRDSTRCVHGWSVGVHNGGCGSSSWSGGGGGARFGIWGWGEAEARLGQIESIRTILLHSSLHSVSSSVLRETSSASSHISSISFSFCEKVIGAGVLAGAGV